MGQLAIPISITCFKAVDIATQTCFPGSALTQLEVKIKEGYG